jgi:methylmalonyl-CoA mutase N-terminal domain/subunit
MKAPSKTPDSEISAAAERWYRELYEPAIARQPERRKFTTDVGIEVKALYTPADVEASGSGYLRDIGFPGEYPFTRGHSATMYRNEPFVVGAYSGYGEAGECNLRYRKLVDMGVRQLMLALDLPTQCGYDSDHEMASAEVGQAGVAISTLKDMEVLFDGIAIDKLTSIAGISNSIGPIIMSMFVAMGERKGLKPVDFGVQLQNDPVTEYIARGTQILPSRASAKLATDCITWCVENAPHWQPMSVSNNHMNAGGAGSVRATAMALGNAIHYIELMLKQGYTVDQVAPHMTFKTDERYDFFVAVANLRALRRIWARLMKERFGAKTIPAMALRMHVYGHGLEALQEPLNNIARIGFGSLAYVLGGATFVFLASYDEAVSLPSEESVRVAVRTQQILANEHGFTDTIDPLGGSYFVETLTNEVEGEILVALAEVEEAGGALGVIESGIGRRWMTEGAARRQRAIDTSERPWVTVNLYPQKKSEQQTAFRINPENTRRQIERLQQVRQSRNQKDVVAALSAIDEACKSGANIVPPVLQAVKAYVTIGEIADRWRANFGEYTPSADF